MTLEATHTVITFESAVDLDTLARAIGDLAARDGRAGMPSVWILGDEALFISHDDFAALDALIARTPCGAVGVRAAIVASSGFNSVVATMWCGQTENLPCEVQVFAEVDDARAWAAHG